MSDASQPARSRRLWPVVGLLVAVVVMLMPWWAPSSDEAPPEPELPTVVEDVPSPSEAPSVAHVQGQVYCEVPRPEPEPVVEVTIDRDGSVNARKVDGGAPSEAEPTEAGPEEASGEAAARDNPADDGAASGDGPTGDGVASGEASARDDAQSGDGPTGDGVASGEAPASDDAQSGDEPSGEDAAFEPPPVDLVPPDSCTVIAWQQGQQVSEPTPCEAEGRFSVPLMPGASGRTAFEVLVPGYLRAVLEVDVPEGGQGRLPPVALGRAVRVDGHVVDSEGTPVPGIVLQAMPHPNLEEPEPWRATSDAEGAFVFDTLPPGPVSVRVEAPGYAVSVVEAFAPQEQLLVTLEALVDLRGRVVGSEAALSRAIVRVEGSGIWPARENPVDAQGQFVFEKVPDGIYALEAVVEAERPGEPELASIPLENVTPELTLTLALVPAFRVPVEVRAPDGSAVEGARVTLSNASIGLLPRISLTDAQGRAAIGPVVPGPYVLRADADGFLPSPPTAVTIEGSGAAPVVLTLAEPGRISGTVVDQDGHPVADARVELLAEHLFTAGEGRTRARFAQAALQAAGSLGVTAGPVPKIPTGDEAEADMGTSVRTGERGGFSFDLLVPGHYRLQAHHADFAGSDQARVRLKAAQKQGGLRLVLRNGYRVTGQVRDGNDRPVEGATVRFDDGGVVYTDRKGVFDGGLHRGRTRIVARAPKLSPTAVEVDVRDGPVDVDIVLLRARAQLSGRVVGGNDEVLANARVTLRTLDGLTATRITWTDAKGVYRFTKLPAGSVEIEIDHPDHGPVTQQVELEEEDTRAEADVELSKGWEIEVEVLAEGTSDPLSGVQIEAGGVHARTDGDGKASLRRLSAERVELSVRAPGFGARTMKVSRDGVDHRRIRVELSPGGDLTGRVTDYRGDAVVGVEVVVRDEDGELLGRARTGAKGRWTLRGVPAGNVEVTVDPPTDREDELAPASLSSDVLRGHMTRGVDLRLDRR